MRLFLTLIRYDGQSPYLHCTVFAILQNAPNAFHPQESNNSTQFAFSKSLIAFQFNLNILDLAGKFSAALLAQGSVSMLCSL